MGSRDALSGGGLMFHHHAAFKTVVGRTLRSTHERCVPKETVHHFLQILSLPEGWGRSAWKLTL